jgi:hypothetical protein
MNSKNRFCLIAILAIVLLAGCDKRVTIESVVSPEGAIDRTISYEQDTSVIENNLFGITEGNGWQIQIEKTTIPETSTVKRSQNRKYQVVAKKHFSSAQDANKEQINDSSFSVRSSFQKQFRWFYTYTKYVDTYGSLNRFAHFPQEDYFSKEDFDFIHRMPAEGEKISKADSIYLDRLSEKIGDYFTAALFEEHFAITIEAARKNTIDQNWLDSLQSHKGEMFSILTKDDDKFTDDAFMMQLIQSIIDGFPIEQIRADYLNSYAALKPRVEFMTTVAAEMHFEHRIVMPGEIVSTNADSTNRATATWKPMVLKFMLQDYSMEAESRTMNYWTVAVTAAFVLLTALLWFRRASMTFG